MRVRSCSSLANVRSVRLVSAATINLILKSVPHECSCPKAQVTGRESITVLLLAVSGRGVRIPLANLLRPESHCLVYPNVAFGSLDHRQKLAALRCGVYSPDFRSPTSGCPIEC